MFLYSGIILKSGMMFVKANEAAGSFSVNYIVLSFTRHGKSYIILLKQYTCKERKSDG